MQWVDGKSYLAPSMSSVIAPLIQGLRTSGNSTLSIDLSSSWNNETVKFSAVNKTDQVVRTYNNGYLWPDPANTTFYHWGGGPSLLFTRFDTASNELVQFLPDGHGAGRWNEQGPNAKSMFTSLKRCDAMAKTYDRVDTAYFLGGYHSCRTSTFSISKCVPSPFIVSYNASTNMWTNDSTSELTPWPNALQWGRMENAPFSSSKGLNIILGGYTAERISDFNALLSLDTIYIHDPVTGKFWNQTATSATGEMPKPRMRFCSVGMVGSNGTFEIFIFGGIDLSKSPEENILLSDNVWVLSLPSFVWFEADYPPRFRRAAHTCNVAPQASSQMIIIGGLDGLAYNRSFSRDPWKNGINVFNLNNMEWESNYDPHAPAYKTPSMITNYIQNSEPLPRLWDYQQVQQLFEATHSSHASPPSPSSSESPTTSSPRKSSINAIVGGVVGGIAGLACTTLIGWFVLRMRRKRQRYRGGNAYEKPELPSSFATKGQYQYHLSDQQSPHEADSNLVNEMFTETDATELDAGGRVRSQQRDEERWGNG